VIAERVGRRLGSPVASSAPLSGGSICRAFEMRLEDGRHLFAKQLDDAHPELFGAEAESLRWLALAGSVPFPAVLESAPDLLVLSWAPSGEPGPAAAERFGHDLALLHRSGAPGLGAAWPGFAGPILLDNAARGNWPAFFAETRILPCLRLARDRGGVTAAEARAVERAVLRLPALAGAAEPPSRLHGDLWSGNLLWDRDRVWLVDPAAYGGNRETDLGLLRLFGAPHLERIVAAYEESWPLPPGWRERQGLHQLHPLLVHAALFGGGYGRWAAEVARAYG
jgi:fructosamine-3-kinase